ncbi:PAS domain S-box-containing protein/diguanylate cyclase (GGDEF)-like protein [Natranaerovirga pectinivora]|uniref:PAS domain S-box-containing protein/diguanylate cyclase (GGDEF)-like protein n=1 Tax=Natranaerovirga pectinivora TaxID=682400 RepID=A0A4R3MQH0_9FIRM|nr:EAL domain-containing protein [Natranaerovirga pectinivora]TCT16126.1 PAS domain S-box-containing protein/diguanylate cyclase (GGDEF)-like protein [Natranaerovirga pectinivora]
MKQMKNKSKIKQRIISLLIIVISSLVISGIIYYSASSRLSNYVASSLTELAIQGSEIVSREIRTKLSTLETLAKVEEIKNPNVPINEKVRLLNEYFITDSYLRISIADTEGYSRTTDEASLYIGDRDYFQHALRGVSYVSETMISRVDGSNVITIAVPVYYQNKIEYVLYGTYAIEALSLITDSIKIGENSDTMILNKEGTILAHREREYVHQGINYLSVFGENEKSKMITQAIEEGRAGAKNYHYEKNNRFMGYAHIQDTHWILVITSAKKDVFGSIGQLLLIILGSIISTLLVLIVLNYYLRYLKSKLNKQQIISKNAIDTASLLVIGFDLNGKIYEFNQHAVNKTGYSKDEVVGKKGIYDIVQENEQIKIRNILNKEKDHSKFELEIIGKNGQSIYGIWSQNSLEDSREKIELIGMDISEMILAQKNLQNQHEELTAVYEELAASEEELKSQFDQLAFHRDQLKDSEERYELVVKAAQIGIWDWNIEEGSHYYSENWYDICGIGKMIDIWYHLILEEDCEYVTSLIERQLTYKKEDFNCEFRILLGENKRWIRLFGKVIWHCNEPYRLVAAFLDITEQKESEEKISKLAYYDPLTNLPNRINLIQHFREVVIQQRKAALIFLDLDNIKLVNDTFGHNFGDLLIIEVSKRLNSVKDYKFVVSRLSGDEFVILLLDSEEKSTINDYCTSLLRLLNKSYQINNTKLHITGSMGIARFPEDGLSFEALLKHSDLAMYKAKENGRNRFVFYEKKMNEEAVQKMTIKNYLVNALKNNEFVLHYQPQYSIEEENEITGFEALIRWNSPELGFVSPVEFISVAEENYMIIPIGIWVLKEACNFIKKYNAYMEKEHIISVNISILQLLQDDFVDMLGDVLEEVNLKPSLLEIEITETMLIKSFDTIVVKLEQIKEKGIHIALDDFGKGYSSLSYLRQLPITTLKIDKSFIDNIEIMDDVDNLTESIIYLAKKMGLNTVAEGVETEKQLEYLKRNQCHKIQGYLFSKPLKEEDVYKVSGKLK